MDNSKNNVPENNNDEKKPAGGLRMFGGVFGSLRNSTKSEGDLSKDLRKLTRTELLEMLIDETKEADRLRKENRRLQKELEGVREELARTASLDIVIAKLEAVIRNAGYRN